MRLCPYCHNPLSDAEVDQLKAENANLRKLVLDMWDFYCVMPDEPHVFKEELDFSVEVWKRMRALGIEIKVDE